MAIAGKWMAAHFNRPGFDDVRLRRLRAGRRRLPDGGRLRRGGLAGRPPEARQPLLDLRQQPHHDRGPHRASPSAKTWPRASSATAGTSRAWATPTTSRCWTARSTTAKKTTDRPTLIIVDSHIGYGAPTKQDTHAAHGEPLGEEEIRLAKRFYGWPEDAKFLVPDGVREHFAAGIGARGAKLRGEWMALLRGLQARSTRRKPTRSTACSTGSFPRAGTKGIPAFPADAKGLAGRDASAKVLNAVAQQRALADRRLGGPGALDQDAPHLRRARETSRPAPTAGATSTSASASTRWARC